LGKKDPDRQTVTPKEKHSYLPSTFASLRHRNYRLFFFAQMVSLIGLHMQWTAQSWLVYDITDSRVDLGLIRMVQTLPLAILPLFGGLIADYFKKRSVLILTQSLAILPPVVLALIVFAGVTQIWHIALLAFLSGVVVSFDMPARQAFVIEMVGREDLMNAISLNSGIFNTARILGPLVAGRMIAAVGIAYCFLANGLSFLPVIIALVLISVSGGETTRRRESPLKRLRGGFAYVKGDIRLVGLFCLLTIIGVFGFSYMALMPAFAKDVFGRGPKGYGDLMAFNGIGAVAGALFVATMAKRGGRLKLLFGGILILSCALTAFSFATHVTSGAAQLLFVGFGMVMFMTTANTLVQTIVPDEYRGRVMGIWTIFFGGSLPIGSITAGVAGQYIGLSMTVKIGSLVCLSSALAASLLLSKIRRSNAEKNNSLPSAGNQRP
jgi:MFS family permease